MDRAEIEAALRGVSDNLAGSEISARVFIVGGDAMVLAYGSRFSTADADADFYPPDQVRAAAETVAAEMDLPDNWLSDSAKIVLPVFKEPEWRPVLKFENLEVSTVDPKSLLAMKIRASRGSRDIADIRVLLAHCDIGTEGEALSIYNEYFPEDPLPERAVPLLKRALAG
jgi:hypothetical protein